MRPVAGGRRRGDRAGRPAPTLRGLPTVPLLLVAATVVVAAAGFAAWWWLPESVHAAVRYLAPLVGVAAARMADVTLGTIRTVLVVAGRRTLAGALASVEAGMWLAAAAFVLDDLSLAGGVAFAAGVGFGTALGLSVVRAAAWGLTTVRVFVDAAGGEPLAQWIRERGHAATVFVGEGRDGPKAMVLSIVTRREARGLAAAVDRRPGTFVTLDSEPAAGFALHTPGRV